MRLTTIKIALVALSMTFALGAAGCGDEACSACQSYCHDCYPDTGMAKLEARTLNDDYEAATFSFRFATVLDDEDVRDNWELLFGNDQDPEMDLFTVRTVTDDRSIIVDLGPMSLCDVPEFVDPAELEVGVYGIHDDIPVVLGHVYVVRSLDSETRLYSAFRVAEHKLNESVTIQWFRSSDPDRLALPDCCQ